MKKAGVLVTLLCTLVLTMFSGCSGLKAPSSRQVMSADSAVHNELI